MTTNKSMRRPKRILLFRLINIALSCNEFPRLAIYLLRSEKMLKLLIKKLICCTLLESVCLNCRVDALQGYIMKTCPCKEHPLTPHFYRPILVKDGVTSLALHPGISQRYKNMAVKLGFTRVYIFFLIFALKHRSWVLVRTASLRRF